MKYLPLIWAALWRKPARSILTFVSALIGFTLFGITMGIDAGFRQLADQARLDRLYVSPRYAGALMVAQRDQIAHLAGITHVAGLATLGGYYRNPTNSIAVMMVDAEMRPVFSELSLTARQWRALDTTRDGIYISRTLASRYGVKPGNNFPLLTPQPTRRDGSRLWTFPVLGVMDDVSFFPTGFALGNYDYLDQARPFAERGQVGQIWLLIADSARAEETAAAIDRLFANSAIPTRSETEKAIFESVGGPNSNVALATQGVAALGLFMIAFLTANTIAQSVRERIHEFAVLKTIGFTDARIVGLVFAEAAIPCLLGACCGLVLAQCLSLLLPYFLPSSATLPFAMGSPLVRGSALIAALIIVLVSTALPALRLARLDVVSALARR